MKLAIYGAGGFGIEVYDIAMRRIKASGTWDDVFFVADVESNNRNLPAKLLTFDEMLTLQEDIECIIAIGEPSYREKMYQKLIEHKVKVATLIDPTSLISPSSVIEEGCIISEFVSIHANVHLGVNCAMQPYSALGHDVITGKHCVFSAHFTPGGTSRFGNRVFAGIGSCSKEKLTIGDDVVIAMGAAVFTDVADGMTLVGNPARSTKPNPQGKVFK